MIERSKHKTVVPTSKSAHCYGGAMVSRRQPGGHAVAVDNLDTASRPVFNVTPCHPTTDGSTWTSTLLTAGRR